jgi:hypothetical protein
MNHKNPDEYVLAPDLDGVVEIEKPKEDKEDR